MKTIKIEFRLGEGVYYGEMPEDFTLENYEERAEQFVSNLAQSMIEEAMISHLSKKNPLLSADLDIIDEVYRWFEGEPESHRDEFLDTKRENLVVYHDTLGRNIRNTFEFWNTAWLPEIVDGVDVSPNHPDNRSMRIIESVWDRARTVYR